MLYVLGGGVCWLWLSDDNQLPKTNLDAKSILTLFQSLLPWFRPILQNSSLTTRLSCNESCLLVIILPREKLALFATMCVYNKARRSLVTSLEKEFRRASNVAAFIHRI